MAKIREIEYCKDIVKEYSTEEIIAWAAKSMKVEMDRCDRALGDKSFERVCVELPNLLMISTVLNNLNEKLNGQKGPNLL